MLLWLFYIIAVPTGTNSALYLGFVSTGWRGLIKNTRQERPRGPRTCAASPFQAPLRTLILLSLHYLKSSVDSVDFLFEQEPIP